MTLLHPLLACSVCYGDPASPLTKGAEAGVIVLGIAIAAVLGTFVGLFLYWSKRARALEAVLAASSRTGAAPDAPLVPADPLPISSRTSTDSPLTLH